MNWSDQAIKHLAVLLAEATENLASALELIAALKKLPATQAAACLEDLLLLSAPAEVIALKSCLQPLEIQVIQDGLQNLKSQTLSSDMVTLSKAQLIWKETITLSSPLPLGLPIAGHPLHMQPSSYHVAETAQRRDLAADPFLEAFLRGDDLAALCADLPETPDLITTLNLPDHPPNTHPPCRPKAMAKKAASKPRTPIDSTLLLVKFKWRHSVKV